MTTMIAAGVPTTAVTMSLFVAVVVIVPLLKSVQRVIAAMHTGSW